MSWEHLWCRSDLLLDLLVQKELLLLGVEEEWLLAGGASGVVWVKPSALSVVLIHVLSESGVMG